MTDEELEKEAEEYALDNYELIEEGQRSDFNARKEGYIAGAEAILEKWRNCYLSCSSPYCAFPDVEVKGNLGQLEKINKSVDTNNTKC